LTGPGGEEANEEGLELVGASSNHMVMEVVAYYLQVEAEGAAC